MNPTTFAMAAVVVRGVQPGAVVPRRAGPAESG
jgi:hypothetical protein